MFKFIQLLCVNNVKELCNLGKFLHYAFKLIDILFKQLLKLNFVHSPLVLYYIFIVTITNMQIVTKMFAL